MSRRSRLRQTDGHHGDTSLKQTGVRIHLRKYQRTVAAFGARSRSQIRLETAVLSLWLESSPGDDNKEPSFAITVAQVRKLIQHSPHLRARRLGREQILIRR